MSQGKKFQSVLCKIDIMNTLMMILGIRPVFDRLKENGTRFSKLGLIFSLIHFILGIYVDHQQRIRQRSSTTFKVLIINGMWSLKRLINFLLPWLTILGSIIQFPAVDKLSRKLQKFDSYLMETQVDISNLEKLKLHFDILAIVVVLGSMIISTASSYFYATIFQKIEFLHIYLALVYYSNVILVALKVCKYFYGIGLRLDLFEKVLGDIRVRQTERQAKPRYWS